MKTNAEIHIVGLAGSGKTQLAALIAHALIAKGVDVTLIEDNGLEVLKGNRLPSYDGLHLPGGRPVTITTKIPGEPFNTLNIS